MMDCIFCSICNGKIPAAKLYEDEDMVIFKDIDPKAEIHLLAMPKEHFASIDEATDSQMQTVSKILKTISQKKADLGLEKGYRIVINYGKDAGQTIFHLHIHVLGGQELIFEDLRTLTL